MMNGALRPVLKAVFLHPLLYLCNLLQLHKIFPKDPGIIRIVKGTKSFKTCSSLCVFAGFSPSGEIADYVLYYLSKIRDEGFDIVFVTTAENLSDESFKKLAPLCVSVIHRTNTGLDFGSWKAGLLHSEPHLTSYRRLLLANDSCYAPILPFSGMLKEIKGDMFGITDSYEMKYHLMSYFIVYSNKVFHSRDFMRQWHSLRMIPTKLKKLIVYLYEVGMSQYYLKKGFSLQAYCPVETLVADSGSGAHKLSRINPVRVFWRQLIEQGKCPVFKVDLLSRSVIPAEDTTWKSVISRTGYDLNLILKHRGLK